MGRWWEMFRRFPTLKLRSYLRKCIPLVPHPRLGCIKLKVWIHFWWSKLPRRRAHRSLARHPIKGGCALLGICAMVNGNWGVPERTLAVVTNPSSSMLTERYFSFTRSPGKLIPSIRIGTRLTDGSCLRIRKR